MLILLLQAKYQLEYFSEVKQQDLHPHCALLWGTCHIYLVHQGLVCITNGYCVVSSTHAVLLQIVLEVHDIAGRLHEITAMLETKQYLVSSKQGLGPETHLVFARRKLHAC